MLGAHTCVQIPICPSLSRETRRGLPQDSQALGRGWCGLWDRNLLGSLLQPLAGPRWAQRPWARPGLAQGSLSLTPAPITPSPTSSPGFPTLKSLEDAFDGKATSLGPS